MVFFTYFTADSDVFVCGWATLKTIKSLSGICLKSLKNNLGVWPWFVSPHHNFKVASVCYQGVPLIGFYELTNWLAVSLYSPIISLQEDTDWN